MTSPTSTPEWCPVLHPALAPELLTEGAEVGSHLPRSGGFGAALVVRHLGGSEYGRFGHEVGSEFLRRLDAHELDTSMSSVHQLRTPTGDRAHRWTGNFVDLSSAFRLYTLVGSAWDRAIDTAWQRAGGWLDGGPTAHELLTTHGYTSRPPTASECMSYRQRHGRPYPPIRRVVVDGRDEVVASMDSTQVLAWLGGRS